MPSKGTSRHPGLYAMSPEERLGRLAQASGLSQASEHALGGEEGLTMDLADHMIENVVGVYGLPLGVATNFVVNGREVLVPMAIEEPSVVAGASYMAKLARHAGGFQAQTGPSEMIGQMQILDVPDLASAQRALLENRQAILDEAASADPVLSQLGGGPRDLQIRTLDDTPSGPMMVLHLVVDTRDAMGANAVNTAVERLTPLVEHLTKGRVHLRILSNLADRRLAKAQCRIPVDALAFDAFRGGQVRDGVIEAWALAAVDPYRAATHNKGIMNGVDAVVIATGNDWRAVEAGAHAYAARSGHYSPLSRWWAGAEGDLEGVLEMPLAVGTVGGATKTHPAARACLDLMQVGTAQELAEVIVCVGLAQNLAALRALATEGIQRGHMQLHAKQIAISAGAEGEAITRIARRMIEEGQINIDWARHLLRQSGEGEH